MNICSAQLRLVAPAAARPVAAARVRTAGPVHQRPCAAEWCRQPSGVKWRQRAVPEEAGSSAATESASPAAAAPAAAAEEPEETVFYEGSGANAELAISLLLGLFIITLPLTIASIGRRLWINYKFTNKRLIVTTNSPILKREVQVEYSKIKEIRSAPRAFGLWGDIVIFLKDGSRLPLAGLESHQKIVDYIYGQMD